MHERAFRNGKLDKGKAIWSNSDELNKLRE